MGSVCKSHNWIDYISSSESESTEAVPYIYVVKYKNSTAASKALDNLGSERILGHSLLISRDGRDKQTLRITVPAVPNIEDQEIKRSLKK